MEKNLDHLTSEEVETLMQRYYAGESVSKLTKEYGISVCSSDLYKLFPPEAFANYICEYCDEPLVINRPSKTMKNLPKYERDLYCPSRFKLTVIAKIARKKKEIFKWSGCSRLKKYIPSHGHLLISHLFLLKTKCF